MKKYLGLLLGGCLLAGCSMADFNGNRTGNDSQFLMEYTILILQIPSCWRPPTVEKSGLADRRLRR